MKYPILSRLIVDSILDSGALAASDADVSKLLTLSGFSDDKISCAEEELVRANLTEEELLDFCCGDEEDIDRLTKSKKLHTANKLIQICFDSFS